MVDAYAFNYLLPTHRTLLKWKREMRYYEKGEQQRERERAREARLKRCTFNFAAHPEQNSMCPHSTSAVSAFFSSQITHSTSADLFSTFTQSVDVSNVLTLALTATPSATFSFSECFSLPAAMSASTSSLVGSSFDLLVSSFWFLLVLLLFIELEEDDVDEEEAAVVEAEVVEEEAMPVEPESEQEREPVLFLSVSKAVPKLVENLPARTEEREEELKSFTTVSTYRGERERERENVSRMKSRQEQLAPACRTMSCRLLIVLAVSQA